MKRTRNVRGTMIPTTMIMAPSVNDVAVGSEAVIVKARAIDIEEGAACCARKRKLGKSGAEKRG